MPSSRIAMFFIILQLTQTIGCNAECHCKKQSKSWDEVKDTIGNVLKYGAVAGAAVAATPIVVSAAGFGAAGVTAGSAAAFIHSTWFGGAITGITGTAFSALTSIGSAGLGIAGKAAIASTSATAVKLYNTVTGGSDNKNCDCSTEIEYRN